MDKLHKFGPIGLLIAVIVRVLVSGAGLADAIMVVSLAALVYLMQKADQSEKIESYIKENSSKVDELTQKIAEQKTDVDSLKSFASAMRITGQSRGR